MKYAKREDKETKEDKPKKASSEFKKKPLVKKSFGRDESRFSGTQSGNDRPRKKPQRNAETHQVLHGARLDDMLTAMVDHYGWKTLGERIKINCFNSNQTIKSSLKFLRTTPWAREKVEDLYLEMMKEK